MKEKINTLKTEIKDIYEKAVKYQTKYPEVEKSFNELPLKKNYYKEESLQEAMEYYLNEVTENEKELLALTNDGSDIEYLTKIAQYIYSDVYDFDKFVKLLDYKKCGIVELVILKEEIIEQTTASEELLEEIKNDVKEEPHVKFITDKASSLITFVGGIVAPYKEVASNQFNTLKEVSMSKLNTTKNSVEQKINEGIKTLSKKLDDFANKNNKE